MKILRIADVPGAAEGGMVGVMTQGGRALAQMGHTVDYLFQEDLGLRVPPKLRRFTSPWRITQAIRKRNRQEHYDIVEIHEPSAALPFLLRPFLGDFGTVVMSHGLEERHWLAQKERWRIRSRRPSIKSRISVPLTVLMPARIGLARAKQIIVPTEEDAEYLTNMGIPLSRVSRVDNGAPLSSSRTPREPKVPVKLLFLGTWLDRKGAPEIVQMAAILAARKVGFRLTLAGTRVPGSEIESLFSPQVREYIDIIPFVPRAQIPALLSDHDVLIAASWFEGMPLTVLEAAGSGLALVITDISGHRQIVRAATEPDQAALVVRPHRPIELADSVSRLCADPALLQDLQDKSWELACRLSWERTARQLVRAYSNALL